MWKIAHLSIAEWNVPWYLTQIVLSYHYLYLYDCSCETKQIYSALLNEKKTIVPWMQTNGGYLPGNDAAIAVEGHICVEV